MSNLITRIKTKIKKTIDFIYFSKRSYDEAQTKKVKIQNSKKGKNIYIHPETELYGNVIINRGTRINGPAYIYSSQDNHVEIGKYCAIAHNLRIRINNHLIQYPNMQGALNTKYNFVQVHGIPKGNIIIGNAVWIGDEVMILPGVEIGNGAVIGARSVVTKSIPPFSVVVGNPAKIIKQRYDQNMIQWLEEIKWWDWDENKIEKNRAFFNTDLTKCSVEEVKLIVV